MSDATPPSAKRGRLNVTESVKLVVGPEKTEIHVHKEILTKSSDFFKRCCDGHDWREKAAKEVLLPEDDIKDVAAYVSWLYCGELVPSENWVRTDITHLPFPELTEAAAPLFCDLLRLAALGDKLGDDAFTNVVVDSYAELHKGTSLWVGPSNIKDFYERLPSSSPLVRMTIDVYRALPHETVFAESSIQKYPKEFLLDLASEMHRDQGQAKPPNPRRANRCKYHIHNDKVPKCT